MRTKTYRARRARQRQDSLKTPKPSAHSEAFRLGSSRPTESPLPTTSHSLKENKPIPLKKSKLYPRVEHLASPFTSRPSSPVASVPISQSARTSPSRQPQQTRRPSAPSAQRPTDWIQLQQSISPADSSYFSSSLSHTDFNRPPSQLGAYTCPEFDIFAHEAVLASTPNPKYAPWDQGDISDDESPFTRGRSLYASAPASPWTDNINVFTHGDCYSPWIEDSLISPPTLFRLPPQLLYQDGAIEEKNQDFRGLVGPDPNENGHSLQPLSSPLHLDIVNTPPRLQNTKSKSKKPILSPKDNLNTSKPPSHPSPLANKSSKTNKPAKTVSRARSGTIRAFINPSPESEQETAKSPKITNPALKATVTLQTSPPLNKHNKPSSRLRSGTIRASASPLEEQQIVNARSLNGTSSSSDDEEDDDENDLTITQLHYTVNPGPSIARRTRSGTIIGPIAPPASSTTQIPTTKVGRTRSGTVVVRFVDPSPKVPLKDGLSCKRVSSSPDPLNFLDDPFDEVEELEWSVAPAPRAPSSKSVAKMKPKRKTKCRLSLNVRFAVGLDKAEEEGVREEEEEEEDEDELLLREGDGVPL